MFTGIVEEIGTVLHIQKGRHSAVLSIQAQEILTDVKIGDSIAVNGVCLTVTSYGEKKFTADIMHETLRRSSLIQLKIGSHVNLERAMPANGRFGGHIVAGHVDGVGTVQKIHQDDTAVWYTIHADPGILKYVIEKGSIAIDGISLTVAGVTEDSFSVSVIPHTAQMTVLSEKKAGDFVNLENDMIGKYVEKLLQPAGGGHQEKSTLTKEFLTKHGYY